ncbi:MAG: amidohydrolase family protein [Verrucomicrobiales bacterium]
MKRRQFLATAALGAMSLPKLITSASEGRGTEIEPIIDIHQHTEYHGRSNQNLIAHQRAMGVTTTVLLPSGVYYGLDAECGGNESVWKLSQELPQEYIFFANELPYLRNAKTVITTWLKKGALGIGEQKFRVLADSHYLANMASIAAEYGVPMLLHFQDTDYNMELQRFHKILEKFPKVNFIGHAQTWWGHIDQKHNPAQMYPKGKVTAGGITDRLLADYPNMFGDLSAGSGLNALTRDEEHTRQFLARHQDKLLFGSDCADSVGTGNGCDGSKIMATVRKCAGSKEIERKILYSNAKKLLQLPSRSDTP